MVADSHSTLGELLLRQAGRQHGGELLEGLATGDRLHPVQEAFLADGAVQRGYCSPGMIMAAVGPLGQRWHRRLLNAERAG